MPVASRAGVAPATTTSRLRASGSWFARGARDLTTPSWRLENIALRGRRRLASTDPPGRVRVGVSATSTSDRPSRSRSDPPERRSPFPIESFEAASFPTAGRFLWASRGLTVGTGLKPLNVESDWLEQDSLDDPEHTWLREMRLRHELIDADVGCVVWEDDAAPAAEALLPMMADWLVARHPDRYCRDPDGGVSVPALDGWSTGPLDRLKGVDALKTAAKLAQEELCLMREDTVEELWNAIVDGEGSEEEDAVGDLSVARHVFRAGVVCFSFDPRKRHGKTLSQVHRPVPGYERKMRDAVARVFTNLKEDKPLWRANWVLQNSPEVISTDLEWHPTNVAIGGVANRAKAAAARAAERARDEGDANVPVADPTFDDSRHTGYMDPLSDLPRTPREAGERMRLRVEYETVRRLPGPSRETSRWILFTVRTHIDPIGAFDAATARALRAAMKTTSPEELKYKSLGDAKLRDVVDAFLRERAGDEDDEEEGAKGKTGGNGGDEGDDDEGNEPSAKDAKKQTGDASFSASEATDPTASARDEETSAASKNNVVAGPTRSRSNVAESADRSPFPSPTPASSEDAEGRRSDSNSPPPSRVSEVVSDVDAASTTSTSAAAQTPTPTASSSSPPSTTDVPSFEKSPPSFTSPPAFGPSVFEAGRAAVASDSGIEPWPTSAWGVAAASTPPSSWYLDPIRVPSVETARVFSRGWQAVGRVDAANAPGSYFVGEVSGIKYLVARGEDGVLRAFHNVCRHHGMEVASAPGDAPGASDDDPNDEAPGFWSRLSRRRSGSGSGSGSNGGFATRFSNDANGKKIAGSSRGFEERSCPLATAKCFSCPYHGWTYDLRGALRESSARTEGMENFDVDRNGLKPLGVATWGPFVFLHLGGAVDGEDAAPGAVNPSPAPPQPIDDAFRAAGLKEEDYAGLAHVATRTYAMDCNWKVFCENYLDGGYHVPFAHPALAAGVAMRSYETEIHGLVSVQRVRARRGDEGEPPIGEARVSDADVEGSKSAGGASTANSAGAAPADAMDEIGFFGDSWRPEDYLPPKANARRPNGSNANRSTAKRSNASNASSDEEFGARRLGESATYAFVYPNFMINRYGPWLDTNWVVPTGPNTCEVTFEYYLERHLADDAAFVAESLAASDLVQREDAWLCEKVQGGLASPGYGAGRYAPSVEAAMYHFHRQLWEDLTEE